jgi:RHS repeat-associated protein
VEQYNITDDPPSDNPQFLNYAPDDGISMYVMTGTAGDLVFYEGYTPFGVGLQPDPSFGSDFGFAGQFTDNTYTNPNNPPSLVNMRARWYNPDTAEFQTVDPDLSGTQQPYEYAAGDPVDNSDPTGMDYSGPTSSGAIDGEVYAVQQALNSINNNAGTGNSVDDDPNLDQWCGIVDASTLSGHTSAAGLSATSSPSQWAVAVLNAMGWPTSQNNVFAFAAWEEGEHSTDWGAADPDAYNPLDTTLADHSHPVGSDLCSSAPITTPGCGVQAYSAAKYGLAATVATLKESQYLCYLNAVFSSVDTDPGGNLATLLSEPPFVGSWPGDSAYVASEYGVEEKRGKAWKG